jgi:ABC-type multidrug transport system fused ATPase/permease subunit
MAFFRILDAVSGTIEIDDIDISELGVRDLRSRLTIIPQDPVLFEGTLRSNLDPLNEHSDDVIWDALRLTHVLESFQVTENSPALSLDNAVNENGSNYSQGQRQLLCLARALLRQSKFIFLDEATASVDPETDAKIQQTVRSEFSNGTILTVAHRLKTIMDYDRVLVLDQGTVREMGTPMELLKKKGVFYDMCQESGEYELLLSMAKK